jgi:hypothetical protein
MVAQRASLAVERSASFPALKRFSAIAWPVEVRA